MLVHRTPEEMEKIRKKYTICHGQDLIQDIRKNCKGDYEKALIALVSPRERTYARGIRATAKGWISGTNKSGLIALLTHKDFHDWSHSPRVPKGIQGRAPTSIEFLRRECSGEFERALVNIAKYTPPANYTASKFPSSGG